MPEHYWGTGLSFYGQIPYVTVCRIINMEESFFSITSYNCLQQSTPDRPTCTNSPIHPVPPSAKFALQQTLPIRQWCHSMLCFSSQTYRQASPLRSLQRWQTLSHTALSHRTSPQCNTILSIYLANSINRAAMNSPFCILSLHSIPMVPLCSCL